MPFLETGRYLRSVNSCDTGRPANVDSHGVRTHADLVEMLGRMRDDYHQSGRDEWENATLDRYLEALQALAHALPNLYANCGQSMPEQPTWEMVALLVAGATGYE